VGSQGGSAVTSQTRGSRIKAVIGGSIGNLIEWYDWFVYSAFALYFAPVFFPAGDQTTQLLNAAAIFAVGFLIRPLGSWIMGVYADRKGRKAALVLSMVMMGFTALGIALTPGYETIGVFAPILLVIFRVGQGISIGGEYGAVATYLSEIAGKKRRGFFSSFQYVTLIMGQLLALVILIILQATLTKEELSTWGWRIPFVIGAIGALAAIWIRRGLDETESFTNVQSSTKKIQSLKLMLAHPKEFFIVLGLTMGGSLGFYTFATYMQKFLTNTSGFTKDQATHIIAGAMVIFMFMQPVMGWISDKVGRRPLFLTYGVIAVLGSVPLLTILESITSMTSAFILITIALIVQSLYTSISGTYKAELFPTEIRAVGVGFPYSIAVACVSGTAEVVALWLKSIGHESWFYWYVTFFMAIFLVTAVMMWDTSKRSRILEE
jgi:MHS family alpha-ketoglutarate permease-like MFS transporter